MTPIPQSEATLFQQASKLTGAERAGFLDQACLGDASLRKRLNALLAAHEESGDSLATSSPALKRTLKLELQTEQDEAVGRTLGRYKLLERLGEGGCGVVYVAEQTMPVRRRVALKVIKVGMDTKQVVARFEAERQALAMMDHPNIAKVLDAGTTDKGRPYFVMELVRGIRITDYCDQNNLSTPERLGLFIKVCQAIQHAHQKGIIHRDIKPSNILVTMHDGVPVPKVIDFGIAKATEGRLTDATVYTQLHQFIGTPAYMSPEQAERSGLDIDTRSDIYSLGVLLYELLAGSTPFDANELMSQGIDAMRKTIREQEPLRPSTKLTMELAAANSKITDQHPSAPNATGTIKVPSRRLTWLKESLAFVRGDLDWIVMKCLEKDRTRRYETANGLASDVQRQLSNEPVMARPPSSAYRFRKLIRRNKTAFVAITAVTLALVLGLATSVWQAARAVKAERLANRQRERADANARAEKAQRENAEAEAQKSRNVLEFIQSMFAGPGNAYADKVTVSQMLDWGSAGMREKFKNQPDVSAAVQYSIAYCYSKIGRWNVAEDYLKHSLELRGESGGYTNVDTLDTVRELASVIFSQGRTGEARDLCARIVESAESGLNLNAANPAQRARFRQLELWACRKLCQIYLEENQPGLARPLAEKLVAAAQNHELSSIESGHAWSELGSVLLAENRPREALNAFTNENRSYSQSDALPVQRAWSEGLRGEAFLALEDYESAELLITNSLPVLEHRFTINHFRVQQAYRDLLSLYSKTGRDQQAEALKSKIIPRSEKK